MYSTSVTVRIILSYYFSYSFTTLCLIPKFEKFGSVFVYEVINNLYVLCLCASFNASVADIDCKFLSTMLHMDVRGIMGKGIDVYQ